MAPPPTLKALQSRHERLDAQILQFKEGVSQQRPDQGQPTVPTVGPLVTPSPFLSVCGRGLHLLQGLIKYLGMGSARILCRLLPFWLLLACADLVATVRKYCPTWPQ